MIKYKIGKKIYENNQDQQSLFYPLKNNFLKKTDFHSQEVKLTKKESECLKLYLQGMTMKEIGKQIFRSPRTIETHIKNIKDKLNVSSRSDVFSRAKEINFLPALGI